MLYKKTPIPKINCFHCNKLILLTKAHKLTWKYTDKTKKYKTSKRYMINTGYTYLCKTCLNKTIKFIN